MPEDTGGNVRLNEGLGVIELRCPKCKRTMMAERQPEDYPEAARIEVTCDRCDDGDFSETMYFDAAGKHITRDPNDDA